VKIARLRISGKKASKLGGATKRKKGTAEKTCIKQGTTKRVEGKSTQKQNSRGAKTTGKGEIETKFFAKTGGAVLKRKCSSKKIKKQENFGRVEAEGVDAGEKGAMGWCGLLRWGDRDRTEGSEKRKFLNFIFPKEKNCPPKKRKSFRREHGMIWGKILQRG